MTRSLSDEYDNINRPRHYLHRGGIEPYDFISSNQLGFAEGNIIKYVMRWSEKGGVVDLEKAQRYLKRLIKEALND